MREEKYFYSMMDISEICGVSYSTVRRWSYEPDFPKCYRFEDMIMTKAIKLGLDVQKDCIYMIIVLIIIM
jgi:hypothetical protein